MKRGQIEGNITEKNIALTSRDAALKLGLDTGTLQPIDLTHRGQLTIVEAWAIHLPNER